MSNTTFGTGNVISVTATNSLAEGQANHINGGNANHAGGVNNIIEDGEANNATGIANHVVSGSYNNVIGANNVVAGFESNVSGTENQTSSIRAGQTITGFGGFFMTNPTSTFAADIFNYSSQLGGGIETPGSANTGEGISMFDRTNINGVYPVGQHSAYLNTSDGLNYSIMLKGKSDLKVGTFVTIGCKKTNGERLIKKAQCGDEVIGVITEAAGFVANAGQFPASERIQYDEFKKPLFTTNTGFPAFRTILAPGVNRTAQFIPYNLRTDYYTVAMMGLVVVRAKFCKGDKHCLKCDVVDGKAVPGDKYFIIQFIDHEHLLILLK